MSGEDVLVPYTDILSQECPPLRILVVGKVRDVRSIFQFIANGNHKSGAGKSALINAVFGVDATPVSHRTPGEHDIDQPLTFPENDRIVIHDSRGFEAGEATNLQKVFDFIERRSKMPALSDRLHAIWVCAEIPFAGARAFERGVERILKECQGTVPIIVVFTKIDILRETQEKKLEEELERQDEEMDDEEFEAKVDTLVDEAVQRLCIEPLRTLTPSGCSDYPWIATSNAREQRFKKTITELVDLALKLAEIEKVWIGMAIAQRSNAKASIKASIRIGRKKYWHGLFSDIFLGFTMRRLLDVLQKDIVNVWNMDDPKDHLKTPEFIALLSVLVEDLSDENRDNYPLTQAAVKSIIDHPSAIIITGPTAVVVLFAEWVRGTYRKTKSSVRCLMGFLVDLTLTMDTLFYLVLAGGQKPMKIGLVNRALRIYKTRKAPVHASIRAWADGWSTFGHLGANEVINKIADIIEEHSVKPEQWEMRDEVADETWMAVDALRETVPVQT
ncbi:hypothetical protein GALMADRAFT_159184 [Galerina marginata CBS 339.88]|uniref:G domain-containing protein n=1 Tax=Galerina marginata (strain CBS 339.88) TaxID=685588 RepID=A0A067SLI1_GALM3|nr:hypothetical protein GALMADRAFT_159184 [Galerina marginata CBS 339.88]